MTARNWTHYRSPLTLCLRVGLGTLLLYAGASKANYPFDLLASIRAYGLLDESAAVLLAMSLPWLEIVTGVCLVVGMASRSAYLVTLLMSCLFVAAQTSALWRGLLVSCGCFGSSDEPINYWTLARTASLMAASILGFGLAWQSGRQGIGARTSGVQVF